MKPLFSASFLEKKLYNYEVPDINNKKAIIDQWCKSISDAKKNETAIKSSFVNKIFTELLDYTRFGDNSKVYNFEEEKNIKGVGQADFILGHFNGGYNIEVAGELKSLYADLDKPQINRKDLKTPVDQGMDYLHNLPESAKFMLASNMNEIRLYKRGLNTNYESFYFLPSEDNKKSILDDFELKKFYYLLNKNNLLTIKGTSQTENLLNLQGEEEKKIEKDFYLKYKEFREKLFFELLKHNIKYESKKSLLLGLTQKFIDRLIFCWFCEDSREELLPSDVLQKLITKEINSEFYDLKGESIYHQVKQLFNAINTGNPVFKIEKGYNGGLFQTDKELDNLIIPNYLFNQVKEFSVYDFGNHELLNVNILGHIFEQSISDLEEMRSHFEGKEYDEKKGKRKKEGVYYTPDYITKYIVEQAVGGWLKDRFNELEEKYKKIFPNFNNNKFEKTKNIIIAFKIDDSKWLKDRDYKKAINDIYKFIDTSQELNQNLSININDLNYVIETVENDRKFRLYNEYQVVLQNIKILDPACGSGAFLFQAFDYLYKENKNVINIIQALNPDQVIFWDNDKEVKRILQNNLYGVDLNNESVEITKLSLWLQTAEKNKKLADLDKNIKCGNSLIDDPEIAGEKAFKWDVEFKNIMKKGGFDIVIGNPPYVRERYIKSEEKEYFVKCFNTGQLSNDLYVYFYEKSYQLLKKNGYLGFITNNTFMRTDFGRNLRKFLCDKTSLKQVLNFGETQFFENVTTYPVIIIYEKDLDKINNVLFFELKERYLIDNYKFNNFIKEQSFDVSSNKFTEFVWSFLNTLQGEQLKEKIKNKGESLKQYVNDAILYGIKSGYTNAFVIDKSTKDEICRIEPNSLRILKPYINNIDRYSFVSSEEQYLILAEYDMDIPEMYPAIFKHLYSFEKELYDRSDKGKNWYNLRKCNYYSEFEIPKIIFQVTKKIPSFTMDLNGFYVDQNCFIIPKEDYYLLGLLNSKLLYFYFLQELTLFQGNTLRFNKSKLELLPVIKTHRENQKPLIINVKNILELNKELQDDYRYLDSILESKTKKKLSFLPVDKELFDYNRPLSVNLDRSYLVIKQENFQTKALLGNMTDKQKDFIKCYFDYMLNHKLKFTKKANINTTLKKLELYKLTDEEFDEYIKTYNKIIETKNKIGHTDKEIDDIVFDLYGLTQEERQIVLDGVK